MGLIASRQNARTEESDSASNQLYKYPAKTGSYFANYFIMGGEKFDAPQPEAYLFGDNTDLNFLGSRPVSFPYPAPQTNDLTHPLKCLVNIRKESLRFVRVEGPVKNLFSIEFTFDCDVRCAITIRYFCTEEFTPSGVVYHSKDEKLNSEVFHYKRGANQQFIQPDHIFNPSSYPDDELGYTVEKDVIPVAIQCVALEGPDEARQSHSTLAVIEHHDGSYTLKALKQKVFVDGLCYLLQEIYGIENKLNEIMETAVDDNEDSGLECVICMCNLRDTLILPCRHLCLCQACADSLRYQANNCPICRSPFRALLHIKTLQKHSGPTLATGDLGDGIPIGFEHISLVEALNGPTVTKRRCERLAKSLRKKAVITAGKNVEEDNESKNEVSPVPKGKLATHDTEDEDKSSSITDHLLYDKSVVCSPSTVHHVNEISNTEDEMPDEDSEAEKMSPLLEVGIINEEDGSPRIEVSFTDPKDIGSSKCASDNSANNSVNESSEKEVLSDVPATENASKALKCVAEDFTCGSSENDTKTSTNCDSLGAEKEVLSQPSTPASIASIRSSDDSYSSSGSSRRLLSSHEKPTLV